MPDQWRRETAALAHDRLAISERVERASRSRRPLPGGFWRAHQVPLTDVKKSPGQLRILEKWMRDLKPEELFGQNGKLIPELKALAPTGDRRMSANPHANGGRVKRALRLPEFADYAVKSNSREPWKSRMFHRWGISFVM